MCLYWGVIPVGGAPSDAPEKLLDFVVQRGRHAGHLDPGETIGPDRLALRELGTLTVQRSHLQDASEEEFFSTFAFAWAHLP